MPIGDDRRPRKPTLPPPPPQSFPIEEEAASGAQAWLPSPDPVARPAAARSLASPKIFAIAAGALVLLVVVLVLARRGGDDVQVRAATREEPLPVEHATPRAVTPPREPARDRPAPVVATGSSDGGADDTAPAMARSDATGSAADSAPQGSASAELGPETGSGSATTPTPTPTPGDAPATGDTPATSDVPKVARGLKALLKGKEIVLEYSGRPAKNSAPDSDQPAIAKARAAYAAATAAFNAGNADTALERCRQALDAYPGYVGAYRGMGLAYERKGDTANALKALRFYVSIVPHASDVEAMRKRIDAMSKR